VNDDEGMLVWAVLVLTLVLAVALWMIALDISDVIGALLLGMVIGSVNALVVVNYRRRGPQ